MLSLKRDGNLFNSMRSKEIPDISIRVLVKRVLFQVQLLGIFLIIGIVLSAMGLDGNTAGPC